MSGLVYLDSSALVKLIVEERESDALRRAAVGWHRRAASALVRVEVPRALRRLGLQPARARPVMSTLALLAIDDQVLDVASELELSSLRSLDAIHLAAALSLGDDLLAFITYDRRLRAAAQAAGLAAQAPS